MDASPNTKYVIRDDVSTEGNGNTDVMEFRAKKEFVIPLSYTYVKDDSYTDISKTHVSETLPERASLPAGKADNKAADSRCSRKKYILVGIVAILGLGVLVGAVVAGVLLTATEEKKEFRYNTACNPSDGNEVCITTDAMCSSGGMCSCPINRQYDEFTDTCVLIHCGQLPNIDNGEIEESTGSNYLDTMKIRCNKGFELSNGEAQVICKTHTSWSEIPTCVPVTCTDVRIPDNGHIDTNFPYGTNYGQGITIACDEGYIMFGEAVVICNADKTWSKGPTCNPVTCSEINPPENAHVDTNVDNGNTYGTKTTIACDEGYSILGEAVVFCKADETWSDTPTCNPVTCSAITVPNNCHVDMNVVNGNAYGSNTTLACDDGYIMNGNATVFCRVDSTWSAIPACIPVMCSELIMPDNGHVDTNALTGKAYGENTTFACDNGYRMTGEAVVFCKADKSWSDFPKCNPVTCSAIIPPDNAHVDTNIANGDTYGETTNIACDEGYDLVGNTIIFCLANATWSDMPTCIPVTCTDIKIPDHGHIESNAVNGNAYGDNTTIACDEGYMLVGGRTVFCLANTTWSDNPTCVPVTCPAINLPDNGRVDANAPNGYSFGENTTITCDDGYKIVGETIVFCKADASWSDIPVCHFSDFWNEWAAWMACDVTCGEGLHSRYRTCNKTGTSDRQCQGNSVEQELCQLAKCPVYGKWTTWESWGACDVTCGGGVQTRTRTCTKVDIGDIDCVGDPNVDQTCSAEVCPDCSKQCSIGTLNAECDACVCNTTVTLKVKSPKGIPINGALIYSSIAKTTVLSTTNDTGLARLESTCLNSEVIVSLTSYQDKRVSMVSEYMDVILELIEYPHVELEPRSKARLAGESVTFCCLALGNPTIKYYEWFLGDNQLPKSLYPNGTHLTLDSVQVSDSGLYMCRANSDVGAVFSPQATLTVKENESGFCEDALIDSYISLPSDCVQESTNSTTYNVGSCNRKICRQANSLEDGSCGNTNYNSVCQASHTEKVIVQCTNYELEYIVITACGCGDYVEPTVTISGIASGLNTGNPLKYGTVLVDGAKRGYTSAAGYFSVSAPLSKTSVTLTFTDEYYKEFLDMTQRISFDSESSESIYITVKMHQAAEPISIDSSTENTLYMGTNASNTNSVAEIVVPADSFYNTKGTPYTGTIKSSLTFIDPTSEENIGNFPGDFQFVNEEGTTTNLESLGVFSLNFYDSSNNTLYTSQPLSMSFNDEVVVSDTSQYEIWGMNEMTGIWEIATKNTTTASRKKRNFKYTAFDSSKYRWLNIDKSTASIYCYFSPIVYEQIQPLKQHDYTYLNMDYYIKRGSSALSFSDNIYKTSKPCFKIACDNEDGILDIYRSNSGVGFREIVPLPGSCYNISVNGRLLHLKLQSNDQTGPLYSTPKKCQSSPSTHTKIKYALVSSSPEVYTFKKVARETKYFPNSSVFVPADNKVWFYEHGNSATRSCHIKVSIDNPLSGRTIKIRAMSKVGTLSGYVGEVLGIREVDHNTTSGSTCVEYRCSNELDNTDVTISLIYQLRSSENGRYTVSLESSVLLSNSPTNFGKETFTVSMPVDMADGIHKHDALEYDTDEDKRLRAVEKVIPASKTECIKSKKKAAVTFSRP